METDTLSGRIINILFFFIFFTFIACILITIGLLISANPESDPIETMSLAAPVSISAGVLIAIFTYSSTLQKNREDKERHQSEVLLQYCNGGFARVLDMLADQNNSNLMWSQACKILLGTVALGKKITNADFIDAYNIEEAKCRASLFHYLSNQNTNNKSRPEGLPPTFFYGISDWQSLSLQSQNEALQYTFGLYDCSAELDSAREIAISGDFGGKIHKYTMVATASNIAIDTTPVIVFYSFLASKNILSKKLQENFIEWAGKPCHFGEEFYQGALLYIKHRLNNPIGLVLSHNDINERLDIITSEG